MNAKQKLQRPYRSPLRDAQSAQTRERILLAAKAFLESEDADKLTLRQVAELAEVSAPTVYAHFPTMDDLLQAFFTWLQPRIGADTALPLLPELANTPRRVYPRYAGQGRLLRNLMNTPTWERLRAGDWKAKQANWAAAVKASLPQLGPTQVERGAIALAAFSTPAVWRWLVDITGCSESEAEHIACWATGALATALKHDAAALGGAESKPLTSIHRKKGSAA